MKMELDRMPRMLVDVQGSDLIRLSGGKKRPMVPANQT